LDTLGRLRAFDFGFAIFGFGGVLSARRKISSRRFSGESFMGMYPVAKGVPTGIAASLGRIVVRWAYQEHVIYTITYMAAGVDVKQGRIAIRQPSIQEQFKMIEDLLAVRGVRFPRGTFSSVGKKAQDVRDRRDSLVHSLWLKTERGLAYQDLKGPAWNVQGQPDRFNWRTTRKMTPGAVLVDRALLKKLRADLEDCIRETRTLHKACIFALQTLRQTQLAQRQKSATTRQQTESALPPQRQSSPE